MTELLPLSVWESFYVIVGSSAGALIGLQFVVITLISERQQPATEETLSAFGTPTVVHFAGALVLSAIMSAPWSALRPLAWIIGSGGFGGLIYGAIVVRRAQRQTGYKPVAEDWIWHAILPVVSYAALAIGGALLGSRTELALFTIAGSGLTLMLIGIHNSWDSVTFIAASSARRSGPPPPSRAS